MHIIILFVHAATNAVTVCDQTTTFAHLISEMYIADHYAQEDIDKLNRVTSDLIASYKEMIEQSSWICLTMMDDCLLKCILNNRFFLVIVETGMQEKSGMVVDCR